MHFDTSMHSLNCPQGAAYTAFHSASLTGNKLVKPEVEGPGIGMSSES